MQIKRTGRSFTFVASTSDGESFIHKNTFNVPFEMLLLVLIHLWNLSLEWRIRASKVLHKSYLGNTKISSEETNTLSISQTGGLVPMPFIKRRKRMVKRVG